MSISTFIENFNTAVDFQNEIAITPETRLTELPEWDSLAALGVIVMFDTEYNKSITGDMIKQCATIQDLFNLAG